QGAGDGGHRVTGRVGVVLVDRGHDRAAAEQLRRVVHRGDGHPQRLGGVAERGAATDRVGRAEVHGVIGGAAGAGPVAVHQADGAVEVVVGQEPDLVGRGEQEGGRGHVDLARLLRNVAPGEAVVDRVLPEAVDVLHGDDGDALGGGSGEPGAGAA